LDEVVGVVEPPTSLVLCGEPLRPDDGEENFGRLDGLLDRVDVVDPRLERVQVVEDPLLSEAGSELLRQRSCFEGGVLTAVADEDAAQEASP
jgi:hypothetical protein